MTPLETLREFCRLRQRSDALAHAEVHDLDVYFSHDGHILVDVEVRGEFVLGRYYRRGHLSPWAVYHIHSCARVSMLTPFEDEAWGTTRRNVKGFDRTVRERYLSEGQACAN